MLASAARWAALGPELERMGFGIVALRKAYPVDPTLLTRRRSSDSPAPPRVVGRHAELAWTLI